MASSPAPPAQKTLREPPAARRPRAKTASPAGRRCRPQRAVDHRASVSVLRRPHDRHRSLCARFPAARTIGDNRSQDRHLMITAIALRRRRADLSPRWSSTGRDDTYSNTAQRHNVPAMTALASYLDFTTCLCLYPTRYRSSSSPLRSVAPTLRVTQIPIAASRHFPRTISRGFVPWRLSDDGPGARRSISIGRHPKPSATGTGTTRPPRLVRFVSISGITRSHRRLEQATSVPRPSLVIQRTSSASADPSLVHTAGGGCQALRHRHRVLLKLLGRWVAPLAIDE